MIIPKNGSIRLNIKDGIIYSLDVEDKDLESKAESLVKKAKEEINPQCLQCVNLITRCAGVFKEESITCSRFRSDNTVDERLKLFYRNGY